MNIGKILGFVGIAAAAAFTGGAALGALGAVGAAGAVGATAGALSTTGAASMLGASTLATGGSIFAGGASSFFSSPFVQKTAGSVLSKIGGAIGESDPDEEREAARKSRGQELLAPRLRLLKKEPDLMAMAREGGGLMPSRMEQPMPSDQTEMGSGAPQPGAPPLEDAESEELTPEEEATMGEVAANASNILYGKKVTKSIVEIFKGGGGQSAAKPLASILASIVEKVMISGLENGQNIEPEMAVAVAGKLTEDVAQTIPQAIGAEPLDSKATQTVFHLTIEMMEKRRQRFAEGRQGVESRMDGGSPPGGGEPPPGPGGGGLAPSLAGGPPNAR